MLHKLGIVFLLFSPFAFGMGGDTPFLVYDCEFNRTTSIKRYFTLRFSNDDKKEVAKWSSNTKRSRLKFRKRDRESVGVTISTGLPLVGYLVPEEFKFTAPLTTPGFDFSMAIKDPINFTTELISLVCTKVKNIIPKD